MGFRGRSTQLAASVSAFRTVSLELGLKIGRYLVASFN